MIKVFIGVGHGGNDPGASYGNFIEKDIALTIALECNKTLLRHNVTTLMSRYKDENDSINSEISECNSFNPNLAVDIHLNAGGGDGFEAFYHFKGGKSLTLAQNIEKEVVKIGQNSRGCKTKVGANGQDYYAFIRNTVCPAIIVECAFLDNAHDVSIINTTVKQKKFGVAIAKGILASLGIAYKEDTTNNANTGANTNKAVRRVIVDGQQVGAYSVSNNITTEVNKAIKNNAKKIEIVLI